MLKNPNYIYGPQNMLVPAKLNFGDYILEKCWLFKDKVAMINGATDERIKYSEIAQEAMNFAVSLARMGVRKGEVVAIFSENRLEYWGAVIGSVCAGAVVTTISTGYVKGEIIHVMNISKPKYVICSPYTYKMHQKTLKAISFVKKIILLGDENFPNVAMYNELVKPEFGLIQNVRFEDFTAVEVRGQTDTAFILYSSGTTGMPKGVMLTHLNVISACCLPPTLDPKDLSLTISPWYHVMGLVGGLNALAIGRTMVYMPKFDVELYLTIIEKYKVQQLVVVPPVLVAVCKHQSNHDLSSVNIVYSGAAPLMKDTIEAVYQVVDIDTRKPLGPNQPGEICCKGNLLMKGYVGKDLREDLDEEGFYKSGDVGYFDEDGFFFIVDRLKELIKYKGYQVPPAELESVLLQHEGVKDAAVIGIEDKAAGEVPLAFIVPQPGKTLTEKEIKDFIAQRLSNPKHLRGGVRFLDQIPKSASGKILRKDLRKLVKSTRSKL